MRLNLRCYIEPWLFRPDGMYNCALARITLAIALWLTINYSMFPGMVWNYDAWNAGFQGLDWQPKGLIKLASYLFSGPPPEWLVIALFESARASIVMMAIGLLVPFSQIWATLATIFIVSLQTSYGPYWSHAFNVQLLAALAFMFARSADVWSVDALIRRCRGLSTMTNKEYYWWPVIFAELATLLFMFGAFFQKFRGNGLWWALSDNLRNSIATSWLQYRADPPDIALWVTAHPFIWKSAGLLQLFVQSTALLAAFLIARPVFRLIFGGVFFFGEILGLDYMFKFWHPFWVPLCFLSIDYEYFWNRFIKKNPIVSRAHTKLTHHRVTTRYKTYVLLLGTLFFGYYLANLAFKLGEKHLNYPFSTMGFYSENRAQRPYAIHQYWPAYTGRIESYEALTDGQVSSTPLPLWYREGDLEDQLRQETLSIKQLKAIDEAYTLRAQRGLYISVARNAPDDLGYVSRSVQSKKTAYRAGIFAVTPFPQPLAFVELHCGLRAVRDDKGFRALIPSIDWHPEKKQYMISFDHEGFVKPTFELLARYNVRKHPVLSEPQALAGHWVESKFYVDNQQKDDLIYTLIRVKDPVLNLDENYYGPGHFRDHQ